MKLRNLLALLVITNIGGCKAPPQQLADNIPVTSDINGLKLTHRYAVSAPSEFTPVDASNRALYAGSIMSKPDFGGKVISPPENGQTYIVLAPVEHSWLAVAGQDKKDMPGCMHSRTLVKSELYAQTQQRDRRAPRKSLKKTACVVVDNDSMACQNANSGTWIID